MSEAAGRWRRTVAGAVSARPVAGYGVVGGVLSGGMAALAVWLAPAGADGPVAWAVAAAYAMQVVAFGALWRMRERGAGFFLAWGGGTLVRMGAVLGLGMVLTWKAAAGMAAVLLSFTGVVVALLFLEPWFFRAGMRNG